MKFSPSHLAALCVVLPLSLTRADSVPVDLFKAADDLEVTLWATTPLLRNPTNIDFDKDGRLYVAEGVNYRSHATRRKEGDRIVILEDTKGEGRADKTSVFVQEPELLAPLGVAVLDNKVYVSQPPDLIVYTDVNRDGKFDPSVDKREVLLSGFNGRQHDHSLHSVIAGPDGKLYFNQGNTGALFTDKSGKTFRIGSPYVHPNGQTVVDPTTIAGKPSDDGHIWIGGFSVRMNADGSNVEIIGHNYRNSFEQTINSLGDMFQSDNDDPPACRVSNILEYGNAGFASADGKRAWRADMRPGQTIPVAEWRQEDPGTMPAGDVYGGGSPTGVAFYENGALGKKWNGTLLTCEAGRNVVFAFHPKADGAGFKLEHTDFVTSNKDKKFAGSDFLGGAKAVTSEIQTMFRPSDVCVGPDGAIYVADWYDARVGGHSDLDDTTSGSIYRIAPKGFKSVIPKIDLDTTEGQIAALKSPALNVRNSGFTRLKAQGEKVVPDVAKLLKDENPYIAARAVWLLAQLGDEGVKKVKALLDSEDGTKRVVAYRALRRADIEVLDMAKRMAGDKSAAVRREVALTLRDVPLDKSKETLVKLAKAFDGKDRAYLEAWGTGCFGKEKEIYEAINKAMGGDPKKWSDTFAWLAWRLHVPAAVEGFKARALSSKLSTKQRKLMMDAMAFVPTQEAADAMVDIAADKSFPFHDNAMWWLFSRKNNDWTEFGLNEKMKERGLYDPSTIKLTASPSPEPPKEPSKLVAADIAKMKGNAKRGAASVAVCYTCHQIDGKGIEFGPNLTAFGKTQTREVILNAIINPSADISHGYEGTHITLKDGMIIDGMVLAHDDPILVKCIGGVIQTVPKDKVKSQKKMDRSLMMSADQLGLDAQKLADIVAYLKSLD